MIARGALVFYHGETLADHIIDGWERMTEHGGGRYWSHVAIAKGDGTAICAWAGGGGIPRGVTDKFLDHYVDPKPGWQTYGAMPQSLAPNAGGVLDLYNAARWYLGDPYDYIGLLADPLWDAFKFKMPGGPPRRFTCSSLVGYLLMSSAWGYRWNKPVRALTPDDIYRAVTFSYMLLP